MPIFPSETGPECPPLQVPSPFNPSLLILSDTLTLTFLFQPGSNPSCPASTFLSLHFCFLVPQPLTAFPDYPPSEIIGVYQCLSLIYGLSLWLLKAQAVSDVFT